MIMNLNRLKKTISLFFLSGLMLIAFCLLTVAGCQKVNVIWVKYNETQCADSWDYSDNNEVLKEHVETYLKGKGVKVLEMEIFIDADPQQNCSSCSCTTGRTIKVKIKKRDLDDVKNLGFYQ